VDGGCGDPAITVMNLLVQRVADLAACGAHSRVLPGGVLVGCNPSRSSSMSQLATMVSRITAPTRVVTIIDGSGPDGGLPTFRARSPRQAESSARA
jgi:hypothetical protein